MPLGCQYQGRRSPEQSPASTSTATCVCRAGPWVELRFSFSAEPGNLGKKGKRRKTWSVKLRDRRDSEAFKQTLGLPTMSCRRVQVLLEQWDSGWKLAILASALSPPHLVSQQTAGSPGMHSWIYYRFASPSQQPASFLSLEEQSSPGKPALPACCLRVGTARGSEPVFTDPGLSPSSNMNWVLVSIRFASLDIFAWGLDFSKKPHAFY